MFRALEEGQDEDRTTVVNEVVDEVKDAFWDRQKVRKYYIRWGYKIQTWKQGLFQKDIRAITLTLFLLWSVTNLVYYGTIFGIEVSTGKSVKDVKLSTISYRNCTSPKVPM